VNKNKTNKYIKRDHEVQVKSFRTFDPSDFAKAAKHSKITLVDSNKEKKNGSISKA